MLWSGEDVTKPGSPSGWTLLCDSVAAPIEAGFVDFTHPHINRGHFDLAQRSCPACGASPAVRSSGWLWLQSELADATCRSVLDPLPGSQRRREPAWLPQAADSHALGRCLTQHLRRRWRSRCQRLLRINFHFWCWGPVPTVLTTTFVCWRRCNLWPEKSRLLLYADAVRQHFGRCRTGQISILSWRWSHWLFKAQLRWRRSTRQPGPWWRGQGPDGNRSFGGRMRVDFQWLRHHDASELLARRYFKARNIDRCIRQPRSTSAFVESGEQPEEHQQLKERMERCQLLGDRDAIRQLLFDGPEALG